MRAILGAGLLCTGLTGLWVESAMAQQTVAQPGSDTATANSDQNGDIVVTAQRRSERLSQVPISISAIDAPALTTAGVSSTISLAKVTPGLVAVSQGFNFSVAIRGISSTGNAVGDETNVALYVDGVYVSTPTVVLFSLNNIERIEVLKGPQGTLFGRNATGGAIRVITKAPSQTASLDASVDYSPSFQARRGQLYVTGGLTSTISADAAIYYFQDDGYITNKNPLWTGGRGRFPPAPRSLGSHQPISQPLLLWIIPTARHRTSCHHAIRICLRRSAI